MSKKHNQKLITPEIFRNAVIGSFVKLNPMIVHGGQYPVNEPEAHLICMLPGRTFQNDMVYLRIEEEDKKGVLII